MGGWLLEEEMPQLNNRPFAWKRRGPRHPMAFKVNQKVIVSNDIVFFKGFIASKPYNINYDEILRSPEWAVLVTIEAQEGAEAFRRDLVTNKDSSSWNRIQINYKHGLWEGTLYGVVTGPNVFNIIIKEL